MANSLAILGQVKLGATALGWPADLTDPPAKIRANGGCWGLVQDPAILEASMSAEEAKADAVSKSEAAKLAAIEAATAIAEAKANAAESAATSAAATDAQARATAARASAIAAAQIATDLAASGAKQEAIDAAKLDATSKANAAEVAAKNAAALDATAKANQAKTDATTAAANDATTKASNAKAEAISAASSDATAKAGLAKTEAVAAATTMTNGIGKNLSSTSAPSTSNLAPNGSVWRRTGTGGRIIGAWEQTGSGVGGTWTPRLIDSQVIDNLDVGKLSSSSATINTAVINKLAVQIATVIELHANRITAGKLTAGQIDTPNLAAALATILQLNADRITAGTINAARLDVNDLSARIATLIQLNADRITAGTVNTDRLNTNEIAARVATVIQLNADRIIAGTIATARLDVIDIAAKTAAFQTVDVKNLFATTGTMSEAVITKLFAEIVKAKMVTSEAFIGENAILTGAVTARTVTASEEMSAKLGEFLRIRTGMLEANAVDGMVITGAVIQSPGDGAGYQLTQNGYTSRDAAGNVTVRLPADGSPAQFKGDVEAQSLTASGRVSLQAAGNEVASGATLVLEAGVTPPLTPPTVGVSYATTPLLPLPSGEVSSGLAFADSLWWRAVDAAGGDSDDRLEAFNSSGVVTRSYPIGVGTKLNGITTIGTEIFILGVKHGQSASTRHVLVYGTDGTFKRDWQYVNYGSGRYQPGIGTDGTNVFIAQPDANGKIIWRSFNKTTGAELTYVESAHNMKSDLAGIYQGAADFGVARVVISKTNGTTEVYTTAGVHQSAVGWFGAGQRQAVGLTFSGGKFWHLQPDALVGYSGIMAPSGAGVGDTDDWWITATWRGASSAETTMGPPQRFKFMRRSELQLSAGTLPAGATGARFYLARKVTTPSRTDFHLLATVTGPSGRVATLPANWETLALPPTTNTFSAASPGTIRSRSANFSVDGAGAGKWGPLTFNADGTMTSSAVPAWVPITSFLNGCSVGDFGFVPAYRAWPDGKVEMRGVIKGTLDVIKTIFSLPSAVRAAQPVNLVAATSGGGTAPAVMRVEIGSLATPDSMSVNPQGTARAWVSLDGLYYYQV